MCERCLHRQRVPLLRGYLRYGASRARTAGRRCRPAPSCASSARRPSSASDKNIHAQSLLLPGQEKGVRVLIGSVYYGDRVLRRASTTDPTRGVSVSQPLHTTSEVSGVYNYFGLVYGSVSGVYILGLEKIRSTSLLSPLSPASATAPFPSLNDDLTRPACVRSAPARLRPRPQLCPRLANLVDLVLLHRLWRRRLSQLAHINLP